MKISKKILGVGVSLGLLVFCTPSVDALSTGIVNGNTSRSVGKPIIEKIGGKDRYETATKIAEKLNYNTAILVNSDKTLADGLSASGLAGALNAPILLTQKNDLPLVTLDKLIGVKKVYIIGGTGTVSESVSKVLKDREIEVIRISGNDRIETSYNVAKEINKINPIKKVVLTNAFKGEPDSMSIAPIAFKEKSPIILTDGNSVSINLKDIESYAIGGTGVMSDKLVKETNSVRLGGKDRFDTNKIVINKYYPNVKEFYLAKSDVLVDSLTGSTIAKDAPIVLVNKGSDKTILKDATKLTILGAIPDAVFNECTDVASNVAPKPEISNKPMPLNEFKSKLPTLGFRYDGVYMEDSLKMGIVNVIDDEVAGFGLHRNSPSFNNTIKTCFNMLLPTKGNELYDIVSKPFKNQTLQMDGRKVVIEQFPQGVSVEIYNK